MTDPMTQLTTSPRLWDLWFRRRLPPKTAAAEDPFDQWLGGHVKSPFLDGWHKRFNDVKNQRHIHFFPWPSWWVWFVHDGNATQKPSIARNLWNSAQRRLNVKSLKRLESQGGQPVVSCWSFGAWIFECCLDHWHVKKSEHLWHVKKSEHLW